MLEPILDAPLAIQIHAFAALEAVLLGPVVLYRKKRDRLHKILGYIWVTNVAIAAISSFFIFGDLAMIGPYGPIHILSVFALWGIFRAVQHAIRKNIVAHKAAMSSIYYWAMGVAGLLTLLPGRRMNEILFGQNEQIGHWVIGIGIAALAIRAARQRQGVREIQPI